MRTNYSSREPHANRLLMQKRGMLQLSEPKMERRKYNRFADKAWITMKCVFKAIKINSKKQFVNLNLVGKHLA